MKIFGRVLRCVTSKNCLDFGDDWITFRYSNGYGYSCWVEVCSLSSASCLYVFLVQYYVLRFCENVLSNLLSENQSWVYCDFLQQTRVCLTDIEHMLIIFVPVIMMVTRCFMRATNETTIWKMIHTHGRSECNGLGSVSTQCVTRICHLSLLQVMNVELTRPVLIDRREWKVPRSTRVCSHLR